MLLSYGMPLTARSQNMAIIVVYDESAFVLRRCRSCGAAAEDEALLAVGISGSGADDETIR